MRKAIVILALLVGCSQKPQQIEVIIKSEPEKPLSTEQIAENAKLKEINELMGPALDRIDELQDMASDKELQTSIAQVMLEQFRIEEKDGKLAAAKFLHDEIVGKSPEEIKKKWLAKFYDG